MLEQAIIDAAALRETAMKSAEASLIEKYSKEFKEKVEKLLEQEEETPPPAEVDQETASANAADPTGPTVTPPAPVTPMATGTGIGMDKKDPFKNVKTAFFNLDGDDDELITINFDQLKAQPSTSQVTMLSSPPAVTAPAPAAEPQPMAEALRIKFKESYDNPGTSYHRSQAEEEELELELELDEDVETSNKAADDLSMQASKKREEAARIQQQSDKARAAAKAEAEKIAKEKGEKSPAESAPVASDVNEEVELTEEELLELEESLMVDMENVPDGYMGTNKREERESKKVAYAKARGDKEVSRREYAKKNLSDLEESLKIMDKKLLKEKEKTDSLNSTNEKLLEAVNSLKDQLDKINISNAKLLYTNKVLSNVSLNERQKSQIVENITKAESVIEAKTIYETLQSTVQSVKEKTPKSLSEAINRGSTPFLTRSKQPASLDSLMADRMKALAGIR
jgi:hypothetical protein